VEQGRTLSVAQARAKYKIAKKRLIGRPIMRTRVAVRMTANFPVQS